ncbi:MAG TPA: hypothetical protein VGI99_07155 [Gemmataceae bacterium]
MSKPYDATSKDIIETDPAGWVAFLGCRVEPGAVRLVDADVSTITAEADKVIRVEQPFPWILHLELQASRDELLPRRLFRYNALLHARHGLPVASVAVLLRTQADSRGMTGLLESASPIGTSLAFRYYVLKVWRRPADDFLNGPIGLLPLAPLGDVKQSALPALVERMRKRIAGRSDRPLAAKLWSASYVLMGLRYETALIESLLSGVRQMEESVTYQAILNRGVKKGRQEGQQEGRQEGQQEGAMVEARRMLLLAAQPKLGTPGKTIKNALDAIADVTRFEHLAARITTVSSWAELLKSK